MENTLKIFVFEEFTILDNSGFLRVSHEKTYTVFETFYNGLQILFSGLVTYSRPPTVDIINCLGAKNRLAF